MLQLPELLGRCRTRGVKLTPQRVAIFESLIGHPGHPSAEEVYQDVLVRYPTLSFATVYNTLQLLTKLGEVREIIVDELRRRYDANVGPHQHAVCRHCHRIVDVRLSEERMDSAFWTRLAEPDLRAHGFVVESASVEFSGLCGACAAGAPAVGAGPADESS